MDTNDATNVFSGHNKYQTILFIGIIIFVIILIVCLFGKFLGLNSHFQNILLSCSEEFQGISFFCNYETQELTKVFTCSVQINAVLIVPFT